MDAIFSVKRERQSFLFCKEYENDESKMDMTVGGQRILSYDEMCVGWTSFPLLQDT